MSTATRQSNPTQHAADIARLEKTLSEIKVGIPIPTSFNPIMYALKVIGKVIGVGDAKGYLLAIISDMRTNGVSEKEAMQREAAFSRAVDTC
jgi:hypothetical protein